ncbi:MAG: PP2C family protein-serine/threonine phosphatase [Jatrophihabitans sp.]|uniref:PP2C family protein-serine/threonine phosphatase n=1 Tax=Jatrophihabitans sp. TaxID=1932789 RepID=UPI003914E1EB
MTTRELGSTVVSAGGARGQDPEAAAAPSGAATTPPPPAVAPGPPVTSRRPVNRISALVLVVGLAMTAVLSWTTFHLNRKNEDRLLRLETKQASTVLSAVVPTIQTPLDSAVGIAARNPDSSAARFRNYITAYVGAKQPFASASLWRVGSGSAQMVTVVGPTPRLAADPAAATKFLTAAKPGRAFDVLGPLGTVARSSLGYAVAASGRTERFVVYAESPLPAGRKAVVAPGSAFSDLRFALFLGTSPTPGMLLEGNTPTLPVEGRTSSVQTPFGTSALLLVAAAQRPLGGPLAARLWWILAIGGGVLSLVAAGTAEGLVRRRLAAERLTGDVEHLLGEQRTIAETLQHALLPQALPQVAGIETAVRYLSGTNGVDIGGDWYDLVPIDSARFFFVVGDVSGRGVPAGSVMGALRFAIRAFVSEGHPPDVVLESLRKMLDVVDDQHFATAVCGLADVERHEVTIANAGHPPPLCVTSDHAVYVDTPVGVPIGVASPHAYSSSSVTVPPGATLLIYTDGLIERRGENLNAGLDRLRALATSAAALPVDAMLDTVVSEIAQGGLDDDTAILGVRWLS